MKYEIVIIPTELESDCWIEIMDTKNLHNPLENFNGKKLSNVHVFTDDELKERDKELEELKLEVAAWRELHEKAVNSINKKIKR